MRFCYAPQMILFALPSLPSSRATFLSSSLAFYSCVLQWTSCGRSTTSSLCTRPWAPLSAIQITMKRTWTTMTSEQGIVIRIGGDSADRRSTRCPSLCRDFSDSSRSLARIPFLVWPCRTACGLFSVLCARNLLSDTHQRLAARAVL
jgi:hypothetical protein